VRLWRGSIGVVRKTPVIFLSPSFWAILGMFDSGSPLPTADWFTKTFECGTYSALPFTSFMATNQGVEHVRMPATGTTSPRGPVNKAFHVNGMRSTSLSSTVPIVSISH